MTETIERVIERVAVAAKENAKPDPVSYAKMAVGDCHRQGDVYLTRIVRLKGEKKTPVQSQLAPGTTQGSRHILESIEGIVMHTPKDATALQGPIIDANNKFTVTHPEHGHVTFPAGLYAVTYQRQYAEELRRVAD